MHLAEKNNPYRTKKPNRDASGRMKSSLRKKRASWGCIWLEEIISTEQISKLGMHPAR